MLTADPAAIASWAAEDADALADRATLLLEWEAWGEARVMCTRLAHMAQRADDPMTTADAEVWNHLIRGELDARSQRYLSALHHLRKARSASLAAGRTSSGAGLHLGVGAVLLEIDEPDEAQAELRQAWSTRHDLSPVRRARCAFLLAECAARSGDRNAHDDWFGLAVQHAARSECAGEFVRRRVDAARFIASGQPAASGHRSDRSSTPDLPRAIELLDTCATDAEHAESPAACSTASARVLVARAALWTSRGSLDGPMAAALTGVVADTTIPLRVRRDAVFVLCDAATEPEDLAQVDELCLRLLESPNGCPDRSVEHGLLDRMASLAERRGDQRMAFGYLRRLVTVRTDLSAEEADRAAAVTSFRLEEDRVRDDAKRARARVAALEADNRALVTYAEQLEHESATDRLTGLGNRRALEQQLALLAGEWPKLVSFAIVDADKFKRVNDEFGHAIGDAVLQRLAATLRRSSRAADLVARVGGEEFAVVIRGADPAEAAAMMERIRASVESERWDEIAPGLSVTVSIGVATARSPDAVRDALRRADDRLYEAKEAGRNAVVGDVEVVRQGFVDANIDQVAPSPLCAVPTALQQVEPSALHLLRLDAWDAFDRWDHERIRSIIEEWRSCRFADSDDSAGALVLAWSFEAQLAVREERQREAIEASEAALLADDNGDELITIDLHIVLGYVAANLSECARAMDHLGIAWLRAASAGTHTQRARIAFLMVLALQILQHHEHALAWLERGRRQSILAGADLLRVRWMLNEFEILLDIATRHEEHGRLDRAAECRRQAAAKAEAHWTEVCTLGSVPYVQSVNRVLYGGAIGLLGDTIRAIQILEAVIDGWQEGIPAESLGTVLTETARIHLRAGDAVAARQYCARALDLGSGEIMRTLRCAVSEVDADAAAALGLYDEAVERLRALLETRSDLARERGVERARISEIRSELQILSRHTEEHDQLADRLTHDRQRLESDVRRLSKEVELDPLTGLANRATIEREAIQRLAGGARSFALVVLDVDRFKAINDEHGHATGDAVLTRLGAVLRHNCRVDDLVGRWGGDEFLAIMTVDSRSAARRSCERLRRAVAAAVWGDPKDPLEVHISVGAALACSCDDFSTLFERADAALYRAKAGGRDNVVVDAGTSVVRGRGST